jgi:hypothetical protein
LLRLGSWRIEPSRTTNTNNSVQTADSNEWEEIKRKRVHSI